MFLYSIHDKKAKRFGVPSAFENDDTAERWFSDLVNDSRSQRPSPIATHPEDYSLYLTGEFSELNGVLTPIDPVLVTHAINLVRDNKITPIDTKSSNA